MPITQKVEPFLVSHIFLLLVLFLWKPMADFPSALVPNFTFLKTSYPLWFSFWPSFLFVIFLKWAKSISASSKVFAATSSFIALHSGSPRYRSFALWAVTLGFLLFLLHLWCLRRTYLPFVSCVFLAFPLSCLNPVWAVLHVSGIPSLWQPLGIPTQLFTLVFLQSSNLGIFFLFSSFFSHRL